MKLNRIYQIILSLFVLACSLGLLYFLAKAAWRLLSSTNTALAVGIIAATSTILVSIISLLISRYFEQKTLIANEHREKKIPVYEELMKFLFKMMMAEKTDNKSLTEKEIIKFMSNFTQKILIWGSDDVILKFYKFRQVGLISPDKPDPSILFCVEDLLLSIRKDLGHKNKDLSRGKLLGLFVNDIEEFIAKNITSR